MKNKRMLILLGGTWHDFEGFAKSIKSILEPHKWVVDATYDFDCLTELKKGSYDLVLSYTCFSKEGWKGEEGFTPTPKSLVWGYTDKQLNALVKWVRNGGAFLASHAATVPGKTNPLLGELIGGVFVEHPPKCDFTVYPLYGEHPITKGIKAFTVQDELYIQKFEPSLNIHMVAIYNGTAYPILWSKREGKGHVAHVALGHSAQVWEFKSYKKLMLQTMEWLVSKKLKKGVV